MKLPEVLKKINGTKVPQGQKVAIAFSGGLDSSLAIELLDSFVLQTQGVVSWKIRAKLYKGNIEIVHRESVNSLFSPEIRSIKSESFDQRWRAHAAKIRGLPFEILAKRNELSQGGHYEIMG